MTNDKTQKARVQVSAFMESFAPDLAEDQVQFFGFLPEIAGFGFQARFCGGHHPQEELGFASFLAAGANLVFEILSGDPVISFAIIPTTSPNTIQARIPMW